MTLSLLLVILSGVSFSVLALAYKQAGETACRPMAFTVVFNTIATLVSIARIFSEEGSWGDWRLWALGLASGTVLFVAQSLMVIISRLGPMSIIWVLMNLSLLVPILLARLFLAEQLLPIDSILLLLLLAIIFAMRSGAENGGNQKGAVSSLFWVLLTVIYLCNGTFQFFSKLKETFFLEKSTAAFTSIVYASGALMALVTLIWRERRVRIFMPEWRAGAIAGVSSSVGLILMLYAMDLPVVVVFAVSIGVALIGGVALTAVVYGERLNFGKVLGWILGLIMVGLAVTRERVNELLPW